MITRSPQIIIPLTFSNGTRTPLTRNSRLSSTSLFESVTCSRSVELSTERTVDLPLFCAAKAFI